MKWMVFSAATALALGGCIPLIQYQDLQKKLAQETNRRREVERKLDNCQDQEAKLREEVKNRPAAKIEPAKLEAIKKQAREEAERRTRGLGQKK